MDMKTHDPHITSPLKCQYQINNCQKPPTMMRQVNQTFQK